MKSRDQEDEELLEYLKGTCLNSRCYVQLIDCCHVTTHHHLANVGLADVTRAGPNYTTLDPINTGQLDQNIVIKSEPCVIKSEPCDTEMSDHLMRISHSYSDTVNNTNIFQSDIADLPSITSANFSDDVKSTTPSLNAIVSSDACLLHSVKTESLEQNNQSVDMDEEDDCMSVVVEDFSDAVMGDTFFIKKRTAASNSARTTSVSPYSSFDEEDDNMSVVVEDFCDAVMGDTFFIKKRTTARHSHRMTLVSPYSSFSFITLQRVFFITKCPYCEDNVSSVLSLLNHISDFHSDDDENFLCPEINCEEHLNHSHAVLSHILDAHPDNVNIGCCICAEEFEDMERAKLHLDSHGTACWVCVTDFKDWYDLKDHIQQIHCSVEKDCYVCPYCTKEEYLNVFSFIVHLRLHFGLRRYKCKFCDKWFDKIPKAGGMAKHVKTHLKTSPVTKCPSCLTFKTNSVNILLDHWKIACSKLRCEICKEKSFRSSNSLSNHTLGCGTSELPHKCEYCKAQFKTKQHMKTHVVNHHDSTKGFPCSIGGCKFIASTKQIHQNHMLSIHGIGVAKGASKAGSSQIYDIKVVETFKCYFPKCNFHAKQESILENHVLVTHVPSKEFRSGRGKKKNFMCNMCGYLFIDQYHTKRHKIAKHGAPSEYYCEKCDVNFPTKTIYDIHQTQNHPSAGKCVFRQTKKSVYKSSQKQAVASSGKTLVDDRKPEIKSEIENSHLFAHNCSKCDYSTTSVIRFKRHQACQVHKGQNWRLKVLQKKPKGCPLCEYIPSIGVGAKGLDRHMFIHYRRGETIPKGYTVAMHNCQLCDYVTCEKGHLKRHMKVHAKQGETLSDQYRVVNFNDSIIN